MSPLLCASHPDRLARLPSLRDVCEGAAEPPLLLVSFRRCVTGFARTGGGPDRAGCHSRRDSGLGDVRSCCRKAQPRRPEGVAFALIPTSTAGPCSNDRHRHLQSTAGGTSRSHSAPSSCVFLGYRPRLVADDRASRHRTLPAVAARLGVVLSHTRAIVIAPSGGTRIFLLVHFDNPRLQESGGLSTDGRNTSTGGAHCHLPRHDHRQRARFTQSSASIYQRWRKTVTFCSKRSPDHPIWRRSPAKPPVIRLVRDESQHAHGANFVFEIGRDSTRSCRDHSGGPNSAGSRLYALYLVHRTRHSGRSCAT